MLQTRLPIVKIASEKIENLERKLGEIYAKTRSKFKIFGTFQKVLVDSATYQSTDLMYEQSPEEFAKRVLIEPLIEFLGFEIVPETVLPSPGGRKKPDYTVRPREKEEPIFYIEAEPLNTDLNSKGRGVSQVKDWLLSRASKTDYGIATDGIRWILLKFEKSSAQSKVFLKVDLRPIFLKMLNPVAFVTKEEIENIERDLLNLHVDYVTLFLEGYLETIEKKKEEISKRFYNDYVRYVFGYDKKGNKAKGTCLLDRVEAPSGTNANDSNLFSIVFMNRLIFIRFLEEKGIVPKDLMNKMLGRYKKSGSPASFYESYLKPLFYEVFNKSEQNRIPTVRQNPLYSQIPYLNGGLFREVISSEKSYNIENEGVELVLQNLLGSYDFGLDHGINPDILGYIFEKTINFISGTGTNQQKMQGAYYTPDDVVTFIIEETLAPILFRKMIEGLRNSGWTDVDLKGYDSIEDILKPENMPKNPKHIENMVGSLGTIRILDPACGSGHFLTAMLAEILRVKESLLRTIEEDVERYKLKREIISQNLFGVDINENAVEIARLRLWLSLIEDVEDSRHIETLPNIDFNIIAGNSLVGWLDEGLLTHPLINLLEDSYIKKSLFDLNESYPDKISEIKEKFKKMKLRDTISAYEKLVDMYSLECGEHAVRIRDTLQYIRKKLYEIISNSYLNFLHEKSIRAKNVLEEISKGLQDRDLFHWRIDFGYVLDDGGFDVVVGNPPYIEDRNYNEIDLKIIKCVKTSRKKKRKTLEEPLLYHSMNCGNTHAYFAERSIRLLKENGRFGFIVPIALVSTDRMASIREFIHRHSSEAKYLSFDDRPGKIFSGLEHCRATIVITEKGAGTKQVFTSKYHRWFSENRSRLFERLQTVNWRFRDPKNIVPKIGSKIEKRILDKIGRKSKGKTIENFETDEGIGVWYHNAPQYWIHAHTQATLPRVEYYKSCKTNDLTGQKMPYGLIESKVSSHYKSLIFEKEDSIIVNGLLNSSLFYWWFVVWSDGRDLLAGHIKSFPIDLTTLQDDHKKALGDLVTELMKKYNESSNIKINQRSEGYFVKIKEIIPSKSKGLIDQIDDILAEYYGFTNVEKRFIKEFDIKFRF